MAPVVQPAMSRVTIPASVNHVQISLSEESLQTIVIVIIQFNTPILTLSAPGVELLHRVVQTDSDGGKAHLPLESRHQSVVKTPGALCAHHGGDGTKHSSILQGSLTFNLLRLSLDLTDSRR